MKHGSDRRSSDLDRYTVNVVDRALTVLELIMDAGRPLSLQEISRRLNIVKSSVFRLLCTLERRGYVERVGGDGRYSLGSNSLRFGYATMPHTPLSEVALPHMRRLLDRFGETLNLGVLRDGEVLYLEMLESPHSFRMAASLGSRSPVHSSALGKAMAAYLPDEDVDQIIRTRGLPALTHRTLTSRVAWKRELARTRARGYSEDNGETELEASCIGAPLFGADGRVVGAISLSGPVSRVRALKPHAVPALVDACGSISRALGHSVSAMQRKGGERRPRSTIVRRPPLARRRG
ncbi:MAG: IclR family transcriptional regulator [Armatimonadota bacterium]